MCDIFVHPTKRMIKVPDTIDNELGAVIEPTVIALHALHRMEAKVGEHVVIIGAGCIGLLTAIVAKAKGLKVIVSDVVDERLEVATSLGAVSYTHLPRFRWFSTAEVESLPSSFEHVLATVFVRSTLPPVYWMPMLKVYAKP